ncbi:MAG: hypothetical protein AMJ53_11320 [Gammaproteobacteria bacterium SG8_11]|nr:MAG: hypothetical protein AMJ53_11320 [Gammaproteobacteria bacterium SG8_11]
MLLSGPYGIAVLPVLLWIIIGFGFRFGKLPMLLSTMTSHLGVTSSFLIVPWWFQHPSAVAAVYLSLIFIPLYTIMFIRRHSKQIKINQSLAKQANQTEERIRASLYTDLHDRVMTPLLGVRHNSYLIEQCTRTIDLLDPDSNGDKVSDVSKYARENLLTLKQMQDALTRTTRRFWSDEMEMLGLSAAVSEYTDSLKSETTGINFSVNIDASTDSLTKDLAVFIYRIITQTIHERLGIARNYHIDVRVDKSNSMVIVVIGDDGEDVAVGFGNDAITSIDYLRERVDAMGGSLVLLKGEEAGIRIEINLPLK